jgi:putative ABC transport system permease protein
LRKKIEAELPEAGFTIADRRDPSPQVSRTLERLRQFLTLIGLTALLVGGVGIANVMVISVLERRSEIGLRRALGATKRHIRTQFLTEALLLALLGGVGGVILGSVITAGYAASQHDPLVIPLSAVALGIGGALAIGAIAGLYPAIRAARLAPTDALRGT